MAYAASPMSEEELNKLKTAGVNTSGIVGGTVGGGGTAGIPAPQQNAGTGYVNLQQYLNQNQGAGEKIGDLATKDLTSAADAYKTQAQSTADTAKTGFSAASKDDTAANLQSGIKSDAYGNYSGAADFLGANYDGPKAADYTSKLAADKNSLANDFGQVGNANFQQQALQKKLGNQGYTQGFGLLDSFLLQGDAKGQEKIKAAQAKGSELSGAYDTAAKTLQDQEAAARAKLDANKATLLNTATAQKDNIVNTGKAKISDLNQSIKDKVDAHSASLGDVLQNKDQLDLEALTSLAKQQADSDWYKKTFVAGRDRPADPPPEVEKIPGQGIDDPPRNPDGGIASRTEDFSHPSVPGLGVFAPPVEVAQKVEAAADKAKPFTDFGAAIDPSKGWNDLMSGKANAGDIWNDLVRDPTAATYDAAKGVSSAANQAVKDTATEAARAGSNVADWLKDRTAGVPVISDLTSAGARGAEYGQKVVDDLKDMSTGKALDSVNKAGGDIKDELKKLEIGDMIPSLKPVDLSMNVSVPSMPALDLGNLNLGNLDLGNLNLGGIGGGLNLGNLGGGLNFGNIDLGNIGNNVKNTVSKAANDVKKEASKLKIPPLKTPKKLKIKISDAREKNLIAPIAREDILEFLSAVKPHFYTYIDDAEGQGVHPGFLAQDLLKSKLGRTIVERTADGVLVVNTWKLQGALVAAMKIALEGESK